MPGTGLPGLWCNDVWHHPSHVAVSSPGKPRPADPIVRDLADGLRHIEFNYQREGSGPGSRFEGRLLEDVQAEWVLRELARTGHGEPVPAKMVIGRTELWCEDHSQVLMVHESISLRTLMFEARRHWREAHDG